MSFRDDFVSNPDPISNDKTPDFSYPPSQPQTSSFDQFHCFGCGDPLEDGVRCQRCTCKWCGYGLREGFCWFCASRDGNSSIDAHNLNSFNDPPNVFTHPPQPQYESYSCKLCRNDAYYGYDCPPRVPLESNEIIKSSVKDLVPIPSESEDTSDNDKGLEDNEIQEYYLCSNLDESALLVTPFSDANEDECFDPGGDIDKIDAFLDIDVSIDFEDSYYESEGDIIYLESLLISDTIPNLLPEVFFDHDPRSLTDEHDNNNLKSMVKVFDLGIQEKIISLTYVRITFEDRHYLFLTFVIKIFLPFLTYPVNSLFSSGSEDIIFDTGIFAYSLYSLEPVVSHRSGTFMSFNVYLNILNEIPMKIYSSTCFVPNITMT
ncbi:hypothetical protein Tco_0760143 [Tanacetum coccineum]